MDALQLAPRHLQVARLARAARQQHAVEFPPQVIHRDVGPHLHAALEAHALLPEQVDPPLHHPLLELEVRNPVAQQPARMLRGLVHRHVETPQVQVGRRGQASRPAAHHRHLQAVARQHGPRKHAPFGERAVGDLPLDLADSHRVAVLRVAARSLAQRRADPPRDLRIRARRQHQLQRVLPAVFKHRQVHVGNRVLDRTARAEAERNAAIHAARRLPRQFVRRQMLLDLVPVPDAFFHRPIAGIDARKIEKRTVMGDGIHAPTPSPFLRAAFSHRRGSSGPARAGIPSAGL